MAAPDVMKMQEANRRERDDGRKKANRMADRHDPPFGPDALSVGTIVEDNRFTV
ncbi:MAG: hypothetical protein HOO98_10440 [Nitrospira sp.]|nr:hypothetical protein [Nitrospira sp.]